MRHSLLLKKVCGALILAGALAIPVGALAEEDDLEALRDEMAQELAAFLEETDQEEQAFRDERDRDFAEFLQEQWTEFDEFAGQIADRTPKPIKIPKAKPKDAVPPIGKIIDPPSAPAKPPIKPALPPAGPEKGPLPSAPVPEKAEPETPPAAPVNPAEEEPAAQPPPAPPALPSPPPEPKPLPVPSPVPESEVGAADEFDFFGERMRISSDPALKARLNGAPGNQTIAAYWKQVASANFPPTVNQLLALRERLRLNDWGYYQLVMQTAESLQGDDNAATLFSWFLLCKSGYTAKVGYSEGTIYLLVPTAQILYGIPYYNLEGTRYYNFTYFKKAEKPGRLYTYQDDYPGAEQPVRLLLEKSPAIRKATANRQLKFHYAGKNYEIPVTYNPNAIRFFATYPQTDLPVFFAAAIESEAEKSLLAGLGPVIAGKRETEAVNIILRFVQTAFEYQTDEQQFAREKYLFAEETLFFPYSDCEDRSILFSYLVRRLTGLEVVGLHYPGHIATAVRFSEKVTGDQLKIGGETFVICDPTFINADIGMAMPQFKTVTPEVIRIGI